MATAHDLKCATGQFDAIERRRKTFAFLVNEHAYQQGDVLVLRRFDQQTQTYTGRELAARVLAKTAAGFGLRAGYCVLAVQVIG
ncbi:DUF3850 domain-containing protein [Burkholderia plantarii]|uniref:DUF3850 domain-containing protein n=1 Tax=Burkholderia plantarii TaxID=41899 RepID=UPI00272A853D|nr:DUF3850 domain-containing protein [Burkholderia plantarii]WLE59253.1 DUF3850 domain-containing protein [Burkholderia plantarii]